MPPPRTNKQYKRFMQQQQQAAAAQAAAAAGTFGSIPSPNAMLLAAALASSEDSEVGADGFAAAGWMQGSRSVHRFSDAGHGRGSGLSSQQRMVHSVMSSAGAGLDVLQQAVAALQQC
jgi:hypothetical protein